MKKILKWGLIGFVVLIVIGAIAGAGKSGNQSSNSGSNTASNGKSESETVHGLNEVVQDGDLAFTVTDVTTAKSLGNSYTQKNAQGMFYVVTLKIENKGNKTATFDSSMAKVCQVPIF